MKAASDDGLRNGRSESLRRFRLADVSRIDQNTNEISSTIKAIERQPIYQAFVIAPFHITDPHATSRFDLTRVDAS